jgi:copper chaperone NosL
MNVPLSESIVPTSQLSITTRLIPRICLGSVRPGGITLCSRLLIAIAALSLSVCYFFPLWHIDLKAPQYPEGLGLRIWINEIGGYHEGDLRKINNLNHYIGMKAIEPASIPELAIMPWIMRGLLLFGLTAAFFGKRSLLMIWLGLFILIAVIGLVDFWMWTYDYGHNLDNERAIIKVPGMIYQPPIFGTRKMLNFEAISWPGIGGWTVMASLGLGLFAAFLEFKRTRQKVREIGAKALPLIVCIGAAALSYGCQDAGPSQIQYGVDQCAYCAMTIADPAFGTQLRTKKGKYLKFDSIECMIASEVSGKVEPSSILKKWVTDFHRPNTCIPIESSILVYTQHQRSPMGLSLAAVANPTAADSLIQRVGGHRLTTIEVVNYVAESWNLPKTGLAAGE